MIAVLKWRWPFIFACSLILFSCTPGDYCTEPIQTFMNAGFYVSDGSVLQDTSLNNGILMRLDKPSSFWSLRNSTSFSIPLQTLADSSGFILQPDSSNQTQRDTLVIRYERKLHYISRACGYQYYFDIQSLNYTKHLLDSIVLKKPAVTNEAGNEHLQLLFKP